MVAIFGGYLRLYHLCLNSGKAIRHEAFSAMDIYKSFLRRNFLCSPRKQLSQVMAMEGHFYIHTTSLSPVARNPDRRPGVSGYYAEGIRLSPDNLTGIIT